MDLSQRLEFATRLAHDAGEIMLKYFQIGVVQEMKADNSPVTIADREVNSMVIAAISKAYPNDAVLGEEESLSKEGAEYLWMCDPIDGTIPYASGIPVNLFTLALLKDGKPILAVTYDPYMKRLYSAIQGEGAFCNGVAIHVNSISELQKSMVGVTGANKNKAFDATGFRGELQKHIARQPQLLSSSYEAMLVAAGQFTATIFPNTTAHDAAASKLIIEEAGGKVTNLEGKDQRYDQPINGAVISNGLVHDQLIALIKPYLTI